MKKCIIVDIDGTLAKMNGRGPFDWDRVDEDSVNEPVKTVVNALAEQLFYIVVFSGRDGICRSKTLKWLIDNGIRFDELFMRDIGNNEKDAIIKRRLYDTHIKDKFYVHLVIDDRNQVVDMWRKDLGLTCLQVDYGDF